MSEQDETKVDPAELGMTSNLLALTELTHVTWNPRAEAEFRGEKASEGNENGYLLCLSLAKELGITKEFEWLAAMQEVDQKTAILSRAGERGGQNIILHEVTRALEMSAPGRALAELSAGLVPKVDAYMIYRAARRRCEMTNFYFQNMIRRLEEDARKELAVLYPLSSRKGKKKAANDDTAAAGMTAETFMNKLPRKRARDLLKRHIRLYRKLVEKLPELKIASPAKEEGEEKQIPPVMDLKTVQAIDEAYEKFLRDHSGALGTVSEQLFKEGPAGSLPSSKENVARHQLDVCEIENRCLSIFYHDLSYSLEAQTPQWEALAQHDRENGTMLSSFALDAYIAAFTQVNFTEHLLPRDPDTVPPEERLEDGWMKNVNLTPTLDEKDGGDTYVVAQVRAGLVRRTRKNYERALHYIYLTSNPERVKAEMRRDLESRVAMKNLVEIQRKKDAARSPAQPPPKEEEEEEEEEDDDEKKPSLFDRAVKAFRETMGDFGTDEEEEEEDSGTGTSGNEAETLNSPRLSSLRFALVQHSMDPAAQYASGDPMLRIYQVAVLLIGWRIYMSNITETTHLRNMAIIDERERGRKEAILDKAGRGAFYFTNLATLFSGAMLIAGTAMGTKWESGALGTSMAFAAISSVLNVGGDPSKIDARGAFRITQRALNQNAARQTAEAQRNYTLSQRLTKLEKEGNGPTGVHATSHGMARELVGNAHNFSMFAGTITSLMQLCNSGSQLASLVNAGAPAAGASTTAAQNSTAFFQQGNEAITHMLNQLVTMGDLDPQVRLIYSEGYSRSMMFYNLVGQTFPVAEATMAPATAPTTLNSVFNIFRMRVSPRDMLVFKDRMINSQFSPAISEIRERLDADVLATSTPEGAVKTEQLIPNITTELFAWANSAITPLYALNQLGVFQTQVAVARCVLDTPLMQTFCTSIDLGMTSGQVAFHGGMAVTLWFMCYVNYRCKVENGLEGRLGDSAMIVNVANEIARKIGMGSVSPSRDDGGLDAMDTVAWMSMRWGKYVTDSLRHRIPMKKTMLAGMVVSQYLIGVLILVWGSVAVHNLIGMDTMESLFLMIWSGGPNAPGVTPSSFLTKTILTEQAAATIPVNMAGTVFALLRFSLIRVHLSLYAIANLHTLLQVGFLAGRFWFVTLSLFLPSVLVGVNKWWQQKQTDIPRNYGEWLFFSNNAGPFDFVTQLIWRAGNLGAEKLHDPPEIDPDNKTKISHETSVYERATYQLANLCTDQGKLVMLACLKPQSAAAAGSGTISSSPNEVTFAYHQYDFSVSDKIKPDEPAFKHVAGQFMRWLSASYHPVMMSLNHEAAFAAQQEALALRGNLANQLLQALKYGKVGSSSNASGEIEVELKTSRLGRITLLVTPLMLDENFRRTSRWNMLGRLSEADHGTCLYAGRLKPIDFRAQEQRYQDYIDAQKDEDDRRRNRSWGQWARSFFPGSSSSGKKVEKQE